MPDEFKPTDFKGWEKKFNTFRREVRKDREEAVRTLSPTQIRQAIRNNEMPPGMEVIIGAKQDGSAFTIDDLKRFDKLRKASAKRWGTAKGAPLLQLMASSLPIDVERANREIRTSRLYRVRGNLLHFQVTASGKYEAEFHQVRVRLEEWAQLMTTARSYKAATSKALAGLISYDCTCGRHQFWYRYLATVGNFAIAPYEKGFPKVRNPGLIGCCCKHVLKTLKTLMSPTVQASLMREMEKQAKSEGFADTTRFMTKKELDRLKKARPGDISETDIANRWKKYQSAQKAFAKKTKGPEGEKLRKEITRLKKREKELADALEKERKQTDKLKRKVKKSIAKHQQNKKTKKNQPIDEPQLKQTLKQHLSFAKLHNLPEKAVVAKFADANNLPVSTVRRLLKQLEGST